MIEKGFKVIIDSREAASPLGARIKESLRLDRIGVEIEVLEVGDYYIPPGEHKPLGILIERKTVEDLVASAKTKRLWTQLGKLYTLENAYPMIILEGSLELIRKFTQWRPEAVAGLICSIVWDFEIPIITTPSWFWSARVIYVLTKKWQREEKHRKIPIRVKVKGERPIDYAKALLSALPGINVNRATILIRKFGNVLNALNNYSRWHGLRGIGPKTLRKIEEILTCGLDEE
ncbi:hypothetical protein DRP04_05045 [Archaeoglobales archaeon]|nr:MAG: hypothetical protein DRP04_05045 [Archaeoglobales archaeon]